MARLSNARSNYVTRWVVPAASRLLIEGACEGASCLPLGKVAHIEMGQSPTGDSCNDLGEGVPFIGGPADLGLVFPQTARWTNAPTKLCKTNDIIVCVRATIGEPRWADKVYCLGRGVAAIRPTHGGTDSRFLFRIIEGNEQALRDQGTGTTFKTISKEHLFRIQVPVIPVEAQQAISNFLEWLEGRDPGGLDVSQAPPLPSSLNEQRRIVARIAALAAKIEEAHGLRGRATEATEVLTLAAVSYAFNFQFPEPLPDCWQWFPLDALLVTPDGMTTGPFGTLLQKTDVRAEGIPVLGIANVQANRFVAGFTDFLDPWKAEALSTYRLEGGDIVIARSGTVGRSCVVPDDIEPKPLMSTNLIRLRVNTEVVLPRLLCLLLNGSALIERHKDAYCRGSSRTFFTQKILFRLQVPLPPTDQQRRIVAYLDKLQAKVDALKKLQAETAAELDALMPSILDKAFRGEL